MTPDPVIRFRLLDPQKNADIPLPSYMTPQSAGMDVHAALDSPLILNPGQIALVPTGFAMALPAGFEAQIRPRSGLAVKYGISLINTPGTIDADYRGEVKLAVVNFGSAAYTLKRGERIAQMIVARVFKARLEVVTRLDPTERNTGGFGHTGR